MTEIKDLTERAGYWLATKTYVLTAKPGHKWGLYRSRWDGSHRYSRVQIQTVSVNLQIVVHRWALMVTYSPVHSLHISLLLLRRAQLSNITNASGLSSAGSLIYCSSAGAKSDTNPFLQIGLSRGRKRQKNGTKTTFAWFLLNGNVQSFTPCVIDNLFEASLNQLECWRICSGPDCVVLVVAEVFIEYWILRTLPRRGM